MENWVISWAGCGSLCPNFWKGQILVESAKKTAIGSAMPLPKPSSRRTCRSWVFAPKILSGHRKKHTLPVGNGECSMRGRMRLSSFRHRRKIIRGILFQRKLIIWDVVTYVYLVVFVGMNTYLQITYFTKKSSFW